MMLKIVKKPDTSSTYNIMLNLGAVVFALMSAALVMAVFGYNPLEIYGKIIEGSTATTYRLQETVNKAIPLCMLSLGVAVAFKMRFWNIGGEGQFYLGAFGASLLAFAFPDWPAPLLLTMMLIAGFVFGGAWALIAAFLKTKFNTNETLTTLMLNYVALKWIAYLQYGPWKDPAARGFPKFPRFSENAILPQLFDVHIGWIITLIMVAVVFVLFKYTKFGYEITVLGENETTARYAGMNVAKITMLAIIISGGLCGVTGMMQASAIEGSLSEQLSGGLGFTAIITAWLGKLNPILIVAVSFVFAMLLQGGAYLQSALQVPAAVAQIIQGIILFFVLGSGFFSEYAIVSKKGLAQLAAKAQEK